MARRFDHGVVLAICVGAVALTGPAWAAADYYLKIGDIKGESKDSAAADHDHKEWIEVSSLSFQGGVRVATGDVDGDGRADAARTTAKRQHKPLTMSKSVDKASPKLAESAAPSAPATIAARGSDPQPVGLLVPAVQKVREAAARMPAWRGCAVGQHIKDVTLREASSGRIAKVLDAKVTECGAEQVSFNFTKIEY